VNRPILTGTIALAAVLAGCGSSGPSLSAFKSGYGAEKAQFNQLGRDLQTVLQTAGKKTDVQLGSEFSGLAARASQQAVALRKLDPPGKFKSQRDQLATDFDTVAADLSAISTAASAHNGATARAATIKLVSDSGSLKAVDQSLTSALGLSQSG
jgi:hypothetical protein